ncbi:hypothetical protein JDV02_000500 [Purpureocillium takamizusanense]|uniref:Uncharacterized protein n=1 Tax=Purpureocillium takamizusanense TaxID=2060973 RepID=A0A9Q8Q7E5_9HYPO|nr:uncharacterized protein JDV02_000500 [Purpureocillium takamizusanense]UNI13792.1 hypothetical protein JDV02_000500 [Purpureocillium takamizusanense]
MASCNSAIGHTNKAVQETSQSYRPPVHDPSDIPLDLESHPATEGPSMQQPVSVVILLASSLASLAAATGTSAATNGATNVKYYIRCAKELSRTFSDVCYTPTARCEGGTYVNPLHATTCKDCVCERQLRRPDVGHKYVPSANTGTGSRSGASHANAMTTPAPHQGQKREPHGLANGHKKHREHHHKKTKSVQFEYRRSPQTEESGPVKTPTE